MTEPLDATERRELCDLLAELGPDAPTLCEGWTTTDLAAHLVVREHNLCAWPAIALGDKVPAAERLTAKLMAQAAARGYEQLTDTVRAGPPFGPFGWSASRSVLNLPEYVVHHEDVRRANDRAPRQGRPDLDQTVWRILSSRSRLYVRRVKGHGVILQWGDERLIAKKGETSAAIAGQPVDLLLYVSGRKSHAEVELTGDSDAVRTVQRVKLGL